MHYWRLLLLTVLATLEPIAQADRLLVYGERRLIHGQERFCGKEAGSLARDTRSPSDGVRNEPAIHRERFYDRTVNNRDNARRTAVDRRSLTRDDQRLNQIRSAEDRTLNNQITRERSAERARELRTIRDTTRRESEQRFLRDVRQNSLERLNPSQRQQARESQRLTELRRTREIYGNRENDMRSSLARQSRRETGFTRGRSSEMTRRERESLNYQLERNLNSRQNYRDDTERIASRARQNDNRIFTNSRGRSSEMTRRERENINDQRNRESDAREFHRDTERISSRARRNDNSRSRSSEMTRRERDNVREQRDREINSGQFNRDTERITSRSRLNDERIFNSRSRSSDMTRRERENINDQRDREINTRQFNRETKRIASRTRHSDNRVESRENSPRDRIYENQRIRAVDRSSIRRVRNFDLERRNSRFIREERNFVRVQSNDRRNSDARVRQESEIRASKSDNERNSETRRVRSTEREASTLMDRRMVTGSVFEQVKSGNWQHPIQKGIETQTSLLRYFFYTLQGLYICSVLVHLAGVYKNEKYNCGFLRILTSPVRKQIKID